MLFVIGKKMGLTTIESWDGILEGCLGKDCPTPCCNVKKVAGADGKTYEYMAMVNADEQQKIVETWVPAKFHMFEMVTGYNVTEYINNLAFEVTGELVIALQGWCLGSNGCLVPHAKPSACKSYPYQVNIDHASGIAQPPVDIFGCPSAVNIISSENNTKKILESRKSAGYPDNKDYIEALIFALSIMGQPKPDWQFLKNEVYMEAIL